MRMTSPSLSLALPPAFTLLHDVPPFYPTRKHTLVETYSTTTKCVVVLGTHMSSPWRSFVPSWLVEPLPGKRLTFRSLPEHVHYTVVRGDLCATTNASRCASTASTTRKKMLKTTNNFRTRKMRLEAALLLQLLLADCL